MDLSSDRSRELADFSGFLRWRHDPEGLSKGHAAERFPITQRSGYRGGDSVDSVAERLRVRSPVAGKPISRKSGDFRHLFNPLRFSNLPE